MAARNGYPEVMLVLALALCFTLAVIAERVVLADILGAFAAGLLLDPDGRGVRTREEDATLAELWHPLSSLFVALFFAVMGLQVNLGSLANLPAVGVRLVLILCAFAGKLACAVKGSSVNRLAVEIGILPRREVGLIFAGMGTTLTLTGQPLLPPTLFSAVVLMVLVTPWSPQWRCGGPFTDAASEPHRGWMRRAYRPSIIRTVPAVHIGPREVTMTHEVLTRLPYRGTVGVLTEPGCAVLRCPTGGP